MAGLGGPAPYWHSWTYDVTGSRLTEKRHAAAGDTTFTYTHPAPGGVRPHAVTQVQMSAPGSSWTRGYSYDNAGNTVGRVSDAGNQQTLTWDAEGHLGSLVEAGKTTSYVYDADGNRLIAKNGDGSKVLYLPNGTEVKLSAGASTATATRYYTHKDTVIAVRTAGGLDWIVADHQGSAEVTVKASTLAVAKQRTLPFGAERGSPPGGWPAGFDKGFVGGTKDTTGLTHLGAREYDPALGRFLSVDPVIDAAEPQQLHPYAYSLNNPVTMSDADGQWPKFLKKAASAVASAASTVGNAVANVVTSTVESIKEDPLKFAVGLAVGIAATVAVAAVCATGVGCLILAGAVAGAAAAGAEYGVDVAQGEREFSVGDLTKEMAIGGVAGAVGAGAGIVGGKILSKARRALRGGDDLAEDAAAAGRRAGPSCAHSFAPATAVLMADGSSKPIADITVGDTVVATDPETGQTIARQIVTTWINQDLDLTDLTITTAPDPDRADQAVQVLQTTAHHPFWDNTEHKWVPAADLQPGHQLRTSDGRTATITAVRNHTGARHMHDLTITDTHTYYVLAGDQPVLVHNRNRAQCDGDEDSFSSGEVDGSERRNRENEKIDDLKKNFTQLVDAGVKIRHHSDVGSPKPPSPAITSSITTATPGDLVGSLVITAVALATAVLRRSGGKNLPI